MTWLWIALAFYAGVSVGWNLHVERKAKRVVRETPTPEEEAMLGQLRLRRAVNSAGPGWVVQRFVLREGEPPGWVDISRQDYTEHFAKQTLRAFQEMDKQDAEDEARENAA